MAGGGRSTHDSSPLVAYCRIRFDNHHNRHFCGHRGHSRQLFGPEPPAGFELSLYIRLFHDLGVFIPFSYDLQFDSHRGSLAMCGVALRSCGAR